MSKERSKREFKPTFENGGFWEYYRDLERQFEDFLNYVPYLDRNEDTYSFRLVNLILAIGAHINSAFEEMAKYPEFAKKYPALLKTIKKKKANIKDYYVLAAYYKLPQREVMFKRLPERENLIPFQQYKLAKDEKGEKKVETPDWWRAYNSVKHRFSQNFEKANLRNARNALASAFLLNVSHKPAALRLYDYNIMKPQLRKGSRIEMKVGVTRKDVVYMLENQGICPGYTETPLFIFNHWKGWK